MLFHVYEFGAYFPCTPVSSDKNRKALPPFSGQLLLYIKTFVHGDIRGDEIHIGYTQNVNVLVTGFTQPCEAVKINISQASGSHIQTQKSKFLFRFYRLRYHISNYPRLSFQAAEEKKNFLIFEMIMLEHFSRISVFEFCHYSTNCKYEYSVQP